MSNNFLIDSPILCAQAVVTSRENDFIEQYVLGSHFPWFWQDRQTFDDEEGIPDNLKKYVKFV